MCAITLNDIPFSFLREHAYILYVNGRGDYRFSYGKNTLPEDYSGSIGDFIDEIHVNQELKKRHPRFLEQIRGILMIMAKDCVLSTSYLIYMRR